MPGSQFQSRGNLFFKDGRRRDTISPADAVPQEEPNKGLIPSFIDFFTPVAAKEAAEVPPPGGGLPGLFDRVILGKDAQGERIPQPSTPFAGPITSALGTLFGDEFAEQFAGPDPAAAQATPDPTHITESIASAESRLEEVRKNILDRPLPSELNFEGRQQLEALNAEAEAEIAAITDEIEVLNSQLKAVNANFATETQFLEALGLPPTVAAAREDPEIAAGLDAVTKAIDSGEGLEAAIDQLAKVGEDELDLLGEAFGRERYLADLQRSIKTQINNLVENRQQVEESLVEAEDWAALEAQAQSNPLWDMTGTPDPSGRGQDVMIGHMEPWLEANFVGVLNQAQLDTAAVVLTSIWNAIPSAEVDAETGELVEADLISAANEALILQLATTGNEQFAGLNMTQDKAQDMLEQMRVAIGRGVEATAQADGWKTAERLNPGEADLATAIYEVAVEIYEDPEMAEQMANSYTLHRLIQIRSGGVFERTEKDSSQFGIGNLPEDTYLDMGYSIENLENNPELQLEALLNFIGQKFFPGYDGLQVALSELVHAPDAWGDL